MTDVMNTASKKALHTTYRRLDKALNQLGFVRKETNDFTFYREAKHGALIVLPKMTADNAVGAPHLTTVRNTLVGKGIVTVEQFPLLVAEPNDKSAMSKSLSGTSRRTRAFTGLRKPVATTQRLAVKKRSSSVSA